MAAPGAWFPRFDSDPSTIPRLFPAVGEYTLRRGKNRGLTYSDETQAPMLLGLMGNFRTGLCCSAAQCRRKIRGAGARLPKSSAPLGMNFHVTGIEGGAFMRIDASALTIRTKTMLDSAGANGNRASMSKPRSEGIHRISSGLMLTPSLFQEEAIGSA